MDNGFLPVDNPSTHLELTMIQKALHLEYSGRDLALIEWGEAMRLTFFLTLLSDLLIPRSIAMLPGVLVPLLYVIKLLVAHYTGLEARRAGTLFIDNASVSIVELEGDHLPRIVAISWSPKPGWLTPPTKPAQPTQATQPAPEAAQSASAGAKEEEQKT